MTDDLTRIVTIPTVGDRTFRLPRRMYEAAALGLYALDKPGASPAWGFLRGPCIVAMLWADEVHPLPVSLPAADAPVAEWEAAGMAVVNHLVDTDGWPEIAVGRVGSALLSAVNERFGLSASEEDIKIRTGFGVPQPGSATSSG